MDRATYDKYFKVNNIGEVIFTGDKLDILIPARYEDKGLTVIQADISTVGIFEIVINDTIRAGMFMPGFITIKPSGIDYITEGDDRYIKASLVKNDVFMVTTEVVKDESLSYKIWQEFVYLGAIPKWMSYTDVAKLFVTLQDITGIRFGVPLVVFEIIVSHLARTEDDIDLEYRLTDMSKPPKFIPLHTVSHAATSVTARIIGSYFKDALNVSMIQEHATQSDLEDILRA